MYRNKRVYAIVLAGGTSQRFGMGIPKQFVKLAGKTVIEHTLNVFENHPLIDEVYLVVNPSYRIMAEEILVRNSYKKVTKILNGGKTRQESSMAGVRAIPDENSFVLIHDAVRPFVNDRIITNVIEKLTYYESVDVAVPATDTIVKVKDDIVVEIPNRNELMYGQTPQGFQTKVIKKAYNMFERNPIPSTDDCSLVLKYDLGKIGVVEGERFNIKITYPEDLYCADKIFQIKSREVSTINEDLLHRFEGKVLVIFGGSRGIGKAIYEVAQHYGAKAYSFSRRNGCDVSKPEDVQAALKKVFEMEKRIDYVVNTAAILRIGTLESRDYDSIISEFMTNYFGTVTVAKESFKYLCKTHGSLLLFASSSYTRGRSLYSIYSSTKAAVVNFAQALAEEWAPFGCSVNVLNPERTNTEMRRESFGIEDPKTLLDPKIVAKIALAVLMSEFSGQVIDVRRNSSISQNLP